MVTAKGPKVTFAEKSLPFQGFLFIGINFLFTTSLPPNAAESLLKISLSLPFTGTQFCSFL